MSKTFKCFCCHRRHEKNPRLKGNQKYCGSRRCQQARKNAWEQERLQNDPTYKSKRQEDKKRWYSKYPGDKYQSEYRKSHPKYCDKNREAQVLRNQKRQPLATVPKIVKTDALIPESVGAQRLYVLLPYEKTDAKKIVKTDALIVQIVTGQGFTGGFLPGGS